MPVRICVHIQYNACVKDRGHLEVASFLSPYYGWQGLSYAAMLQALG